MTNCTTVIYNSAIFFFKFRLLRISSGWACHSKHKPIPNIVDKVFYRLYLPIRTRHVIMLTAVPSVALHASVVKQQNWVMHVTYLSPHCPQIPVLIFTARRVCIARTIPSQDVCLSVCLSVCHTPVFCRHRWTYPQSRARSIERRHFQRPWTTPTHDLHKTYLQMSFRMTLSEIFDDKASRGLSATLRQLSYLFSVIIVVVTTHARG